jgi:acetyl-CoA carboxylase beta subunit
LVLLVRALSVKQLEKIYLKGFQSSEFVLDHGFLDFIIDRRNLKNRLATLLKMLQ